YNPDGTLNITTTAPQNLNTTTGSWLTTGNAGTVIPTNFIGTTDNVDWVIRTNNLERLRVLKTGFVGINVVAPTAFVEVNAAANVRAFYAHNNNVGGYLGYDVSFNIGTPPQAISGAGIYAANPTAGYTSMYAQSTGAATVAAAIQYSTVWIANYAYTNSNTAGVNPPASYAELNIRSAGITGIQSAVFGTTLRGALGANAGTATGGLFFGGSAANDEDANGVMGLANGKATGANPAGGYTGTALNVTGGGYFQSNANWAYVSLSSTVARKIVGTGTVNEIISSPTHGRITLTCPESPEYWYTDYGNAVLVNGKAHVELDPILKDVSMIDADNPIKVICQPGFENCKGIAVINKTSSGFDIVELNGGTGNGPVDYQVVVKPKTNYGEGRFAQAPGPVCVKPDQEPASAKAANQLIGKTIYHWPSDWDAYHYDPEQFTPIGQMITAGPHMGEIKLGNGQYGQGLPATKPSK
ncbi:MAG: hypothetical protein JWO06_278, partial [Bacteroidota bacterium]|nr:hypothetical protein [Bacteroidota bacterium]